MKFLLDESCKESSASNVSAIQVAEHGCTSSEPKQRAEISTNTYIPVQERKDRWISETHGSANLAELMAPAHCVTQHQN